MGCVPVKEIAMSRDILRAFDQAGIGIASATMAIVELPPWCNASFARVIAKTGYDGVVPSNTPAATQFDNISSLSLFSAPHNQSYVKVVVYFPLSPVLTESRPCSEQIVKDPRAPGPALPEPPGRKNDTLPCPLRRSGHDSRLAAIHRRLPPRRYQLLASSAIGQAFRSRLRNRSSGGLLGQPVKAVARQNARTREPYRRCVTFRDAMAEIHGTMASSCPGGAPRTRTRLRIRVHMLQEAWAFAKSQRPVAALSFQQFLDRLCRQSSVFGEVLLSMWTMLCSINSVEKNMHARRSALMPTPRLSSATLKTQRWCRHGLARNDSGLIGRSIPRILSRPGHPGTMCSGCWPEPGGDDNGNSPRPSDLAHADCL